MKRMRFRILLLGILPLIFVGCISQKDIEFRGIRHLRPETIGKETQFSMEVVVYNPNNWGFVVETTTANFLINGKKIGSSELLSSFRMPSKTEMIIPVVVKSSLSDLVRLIPSGLEAVLTGKEMIASTTGTVKAKKFIFHKTIPFEVSQPLDRQLINSILK